MLSEAPAVKGCGGRGGFGVISFNPRAKKFRTQMHRVVKGINLYGHIIFSR